ncbi:toxin VasX [Yoonia sp. SDW83-1]|uniref:toxin VasX n=1 Tax=Yoonia sp. SDW83-1 TaxID=3366945 RepID=UPI00398C4961
MEETLEAGLIDDVEGAASPGTDAGAAERPCDSTITPIYPVRYAYANFFEEGLEAPAPPPSLSTLIGARTVAAGNGYVIRLLREGWIYIREESGGTNFQIFRYTRTDSGGYVSEKFEKYLFTNRINAQGGLTLDRSSGRASYPFVFVAKGVSEVSIAYSEHQWSADVIDRMNGNAATRAKAMQKVNIEAESSDHSVSASKDNLGSLVEDYKRRQDRVLALSGGDTEGLSLDILTTEASYSLDPSKIAQEIQSKLCYGETAKIVALHDPVGRQKEIVQAHAKLSVWEKDRAALTLYPYMIGQFVQGALDSGVEEVREAAEDNVNLDEHKEFWCEMEEEFDTFKARRASFAALYQAFMFPGSTPALNDDVGSLDSYFKYFFAYNPGDETELRNLADVSAGIFEGLMASDEAKAALEATMEHAHVDEADTPIIDQKNAYGIITKGIIALTTTPQAEFDWANSSAIAMDRVLNGLGVMWGSAAANLRYSTQLAGRAGNRLSAGTLQAIVDKVIPSVLKVFGLRIMPGGGVNLTSAEIGRLVAEALDANVARGGNAGLEILERAAARVERGQRMFNWGQSQRSSRLPRLWKLATIEITRPAGSRFAFTVTERTSQRIGLVFEGGFAGLSAFFNIMTIKDLSNQSRFSNANPLQKGNMAYDALRFGSAISALTVDMMILSRGGLMVSQQVVRVLPASVATRLVPGLNSGAKHLGRLLAGKLATSLVAVANFAGAVVSAWEAVREAQQGNTGAAVGHAMVALGSAILFFGAAATLSGAAGASASTGIGLPVAVICAALALIVGGVGMILWFSKGPFETLLYQSFWGKSSNYAFWFTDNRPPVADRLRRAQDITNEQISASYQIELQEFMNYFALPQMSLDRTGGSSLRRWTGSMISDETFYSVTLILPQFQPGTSEIVAGVHTISGFDPSGQLETKLNEEKTAIFARAIRDAMENPTKHSYVGGVLKLNFDVDFGQRANIFWGYLPSPHVLVPMRFLTNYGQLNMQGVQAGMLNERPL